jgi:hypothetical protein
MIKTHLNLDRHPLDQPESLAYQRLVAQCQSDFKAHGMFKLDDFVKPASIERTAADLEKLVACEGFNHVRRHNIYFTDQVAGAAAEHPALARFTTANHTLCADQLAGSLVEEIYEWPPLAVFLARVLGKSRLFLMDDSLARINVLAYGPGETLNWHFDRSQFTTTLMVQTPDAGGAFEYRMGLRSDTEPNLDGVARLLRGEDRAVAVQSLGAGSLSVFAGKNTAHRVTAVEGAKSRIAAVFSYYDSPGIRFSAAERMGFYGRPS